MRRKDREKDREFGLEVIDNTDYGVMTLKKNAYSIPLTFSREGETLYFHCAKVGEKIDYIEDGDGVRIVFVSQSQTPIGHTPERVRELLKSGEISLSKVFTIGYKSAIVEGRIYRVEDEKEKVHSLRILSERLVPNMMEFFEQAIERSIKITGVYKIELDQIESKCKEVPKI